MTFEKFKKMRYEAYSDISLHLPFLEYLSRQCNHVTEFGVRDAFSTAAFIAGCKNKVVSYDIQETEAVTQLKEMVLPCRWEFILGDTTDESVEIEETDLLFIDTLHTIEQLKKELDLHGHKAKRWIGFHDTVTQGKVSMDVTGAEGINRAIEEYMQITNCWEPIYKADFNNGLLIIERKNNNENCCNGK